MKRLTQHKPVNPLPLWLLVSVLVFGLGGMVGCRKDSPESQTQKTQEPGESLAQKTEPQPPAPQPEESSKTETPPETPAKPPKSADPPPPPPSSQEIAAAELKKRGAEVKFNKNGDVDTVDWEGAEITDDDLVLLKPLTYLSDLNLAGTPITDAGLMHLEGLTFLRYLYLLGTPITDAGLPTLQSHSRLERLCLDGTKVSDQGVKHLEPLTRLVMLHLATQGEITDTCIDSLIKLQELHELKIVGTKITEAGRARLAKALPKMRFIGEGEAEGEVE